MEIISQMCSKKTKQPLSSIVKLFFIIPLFLTACGGENESMDDNTSQSTNESISFKIPESLTSNKLVSTGTLSASITVNGDPTPMTINGTNASVTLEDIATGSTTFIITFTFNHDTFGPLVIASATRTEIIDKGDNNLSFALTDYDFSMDTDNDGVSNLDELDENSTSSPLVSACVVGSGTLGDCEL